MTETEGWREVLREIDFQVTVTEQDARDSRNSMNSGMLKAWKAAQKVVAAQITRDREKSSNGKDNKRSSK